MATSAIDKNPKKVNKMKAMRAKAPTTGGVRTPRHCCLFCNGNGYTDREEDEQREIFELLKDIGNLQNKNIELLKEIKKYESEEEKVKAMNLEMEEFLTQIPLGNLSVKNDRIVEITSVKADCDVKAVDPEKKKGEEKSFRKEKLKKMWLRKEENMRKELEQQRKVSNQSKILKKETVRLAVPKELWGHQTISWTPWALPLPPRPGCRRSTVAPRSKPKAVPRSSPSATRFSSKEPKAKSLPKPFSIPFQPQPFPTFAKKFRVKPPPKLPPSVHTVPAQCAPLSCNILPPDELNVNNVTREMFADTIENAVSADFAEHPYYDHEYDDQFDESDYNTFCVDIVASDHHHTDDDQSCYDSDDLGLDNASDAAYEEETAIADYEEIAADVYENHPYGNDLDVEEDYAVHEDHPYEDSNDAIDDGSTATDVAWEETPYYPTDDDQQDTYEDQQDIAWEDSPYY